MTSFLQSFLRNFVGLAFSSYLSKLLYELKFVPSCFFNLHVAVLYKSTDFTRVRYNFFFHLLNIYIYPSLCPHNVSSAATSSVGALRWRKIYSLYLSFIRFMAIFDRTFLIIWSNIFGRKFFRGPLGFPGCWVGTFVPFLTSIYVCVLRSIHSAHI